MISDPSIITSQTFSGCSKSLGHSPKFEVFATLGGLSKAFELFSNVWAHTAHFRKLFSLGASPKHCKFFKRSRPDCQMFKKLRRLGTDRWTFKSFSKCGPDPKRVPFFKTTGPRPPSIWKCVQHLPGDAPEKTHVCAYCRYGRLKKARTRQVCPPKSKLGYLTVWFRQSGN